MLESHPSGKCGATVPVEQSHPTNGQEKLYNGIARRNVATGFPMEVTSRLQREEHRKDGGRITQHGETCRGGGERGQDRLDACREHGGRDNREGALPRQETGTAEPHDRLRVHPQGAAPERRDEETAVGRILRSAHVLAVLPLHPAGGTETQGDHAHPPPPRGNRGG